MDIRVLRYFVTVAKAQNITRAAEALHISQPSLSKQLIALEAELGKPLLIRGKRRIDLTDDGILLLRRAEELLTLFDKTRQELTGNEKIISGKVAIGGRITGEILSAATALRQKHRDVTFDFYSSGAADVTARLDHGSLDFAILLQPVDALKYDYLSLKNSSYWGLLMPWDCPLATKPAVEKADLLTVPLILHGRAGLLREISHWAETDIEKLQVAATYNILSGDPPELVRQGLGCLLIDKDRLPGDPGADLCFKPLSPKLPLDYALVWKRGALLTRQAQAFINELGGTV